LSRVLIDTGGHRAQEVYDACWRHGWIGIKGTDKEFYTHTDAKGRQTTRLVAPQTEILNYESKGAYLPLLLLASTGAKDILANLRDGKGRPWRAPATIGEAYLREINSEAKELVGPGKWRWKQIGQRKNEAWDLEYMQVVIASEAGIFKL
jgi:phage terminase large subunit GpA-like protein